MPNNILWLFAPTLGGMIRFDLVNLMIGLPYILDKRIKKRDGGGNAGNTKNTNEKNMCYLFSLERTTSN